MRQWSALSFVLLLSMSGCIGYPEPFRGASEVRGLYGAALVDAVERMSPASRVDFYVYAYCAQEPPKYEVLELLADKGSALVPYVVSSLREEPGGLSLAQSDWRRWALAVLLAAIDQRSCDLSSDKAVFEAMHLAGEATVNEELRKMMLTKAADMATHRERRLPPCPRVDSIDSDSRADTGKNGPRGTAQRVDLIEDSLRL